MTSVFLRPVEWARMSRGSFFFIDGTVTPVFLALTIWFNPKTWMNLLKLGYGWAYKVVGSSSKPTKKRRKTLPYVSVFISQWICKLIALISGWIWQQIQYSKHFQTEIVVNFVFHSKFLSISICWHSIEANLNVV